MKVFFLMLFFSLQVFSALTIEDLKQTFLDESQLGPMSYDKLVELEDALIDIGREDIIQKLLEKLNRDQLSFLSSIIHVCKLEGDTLGTYQRGETSIQKSSLEPDADIYDLRAYWQRADLLDVINAAYKYEVLNTGVYAALVVMEWPVICIRPGKMLANNLATFAHEVEHFLGDEEKALDITTFENEQDYIIKNLYRSGGEFDAYQAGAMLYHNLASEVGYQTPQSFMRYFDADGILLDPMGLETFILDELGYKDNFKANYRSQVVNSYNETVSDYNTLTEWFALYENNLDVYLYNQDVYTGNIPIYERNKRIYANRGDTEKVQAMELKIQAARENLQKAKEAILFYENIIELKISTLDDLQKDISIIQDLLIKLRRPSINP